MMTKDQSWILTDLDAHTIDFEPFKYDFVNITLFRSVDYQNPFVLHSLHRQRQQRHSQQLFSLSQDCQTGAPHREKSGLR